jgi:hypothetical protein
MDDIPGRLIGMKIGKDALDFAERYFTKSSQPDSTYAFNVFPNPTTCVTQIEMDYEGVLPVQVFSMEGRLMLTNNLAFIGNQAILDLSTLPSGMYVIIGTDENGNRLFNEKIVRL